VQYRHIYKILVSAPVCFLTQNGVTSLKAMSLKYCIVLYLCIYIAPLVLHTNHRCSQCERAREKTVVLRQVKMRHLTHQLINMKECIEKGSWFHSCRPNVCSFVSIGPSLWNALSPSVRSTLLSSSLSSALSLLKTCFFSGGLAHWERL
jgi:hypothetical protein